MCQVCSDTRFVWLARVIDGVARWPGRRVSCPACLVFVLGGIQ